MPWGWGVWFTELSCGSGGFDSMCLGDGGVWKKSVAHPPLRIISGTALIIIESRIANIKIIFLWYLLDSVISVSSILCVTYKSTFSLHSPLDLNLPTHFTPQHEDSLSPTPTPENTSPHQRRQVGGGLGSWVLWTHFLVYLGFGKERQ